jgi:hypothetical protein
MAFATAPQETTAAGLKAMYSEEPDRIMLEDTEEPYGLMYLVWFKQKRILFIKPDGKRQTFTGLQKR